VFVVMDSGRRRGEQRFKPGLAHMQRLLLQVLAVNFEQV
jgi:hypothetical protein